MCCRRVNRQINQRKTTGTGRCSSESISGRLSSKESAFPCLEGNEAAFFPAVNHQRVSRVRETLKGWGSVNPEKTVVLTAGPMLHRNPIDHPFMMAVTSRPGRC
jgi:hypothetical protein